MIKVLKTIRKEQGLYLVVTEVDAEAANLTKESHKNQVDAEIAVHLTKISKDIDSDTVARQLKDYLVECVFSHYVDMVAVLDYIYVVRKIIRLAMEYPAHGKFIFMTEFKNYVSEDDQEKKCDKDDCDKDGCDKDGCDEDDCDEDGDGCDKEGVLIKQGTFKR